VGIADFAISKGCGRAWETCFWFSSRVQQTVISTALFGFRMTVWGLWLLLRVIRLRRLCRRCRKLASGVLNLKIPFSLGDGRLYLLLRVGVVAPGTTGLCRID
jgi:hypothetical protein